MRRWNRQLVIVIALLLGVPSVAYAQYEQSTSYSMNESQIGGNGLLKSSSSSYSLTPTSPNDGGESLGATTGGHSSSASYSSNTGYDTTAQPGLMLVVNTGAVSLGSLSTGAATFGTATFDVTDYTASGYTVQAIGAGPSNAGHTLTQLTTDTASAAGTEQFGINTVRNTVAGKGAQPLYVPDNISYPSVSQFSYGVAGDGATGTYGTNRPYTISDKYRYNSGDVIASSPKTSGDTRFTITFMANISTITPAGQYQGPIDLVATGSF